MDERRRAKRINVNMKISYVGGQREQRMGEVTNISMSGMYVKAEVPVAIGRDFSGSLDAPEIGKVISLGGKVLREGKHGMAIEFTHSDQAVMETLIH